MKSLSRVRLFVTPWTAAHQAPLSMGFSRQEYWSGVPYMYIYHNFFIHSSVNGHLGGFRALTIVNYTKWSMSEREKQILHINTYIWNLEKWLLMNLSSGQEWRHRCREWACGPSCGRRRWDQLGEWHGNTHTATCEAGSWWEAAAEPRQLSSVLCDDLGVGWGRWWEGGSRARGYMYTYDWVMILYGRKQHKPTQHCKAIIVQLKKRRVAPAKFHFQTFKSLFQKASWISDPGMWQTAEKGYGRGYQ